MTISEKVLIKFDADTRDAIANLAKLQDGVGGVGGESKKTEGKVGEAFKKMTIGLLAFNQGIQAAQTLLGGLEKAIDLAKFSGTINRLGKVVSEGLVSRIEKATGGTIDQMTIMEQSAAALTSKLSLTEDQITMVFQAADTLSKKSPVFGDTTTIANKMFEALRTGGVDSLKTLGYAFEEGLKPASRFDAALRQIHETAQEEAPFDAQAEATDRASAALTNLANTIKHTLGTAVAVFLESLQKVSAEYDHWLERRFKNPDGTYTVKVRGLAGLPIGVPGGLNPHNPLVSGVLSGAPAAAAGTNSVLLQHGQMSWEQRQALERGKEQSKPKGKSRMIEKVVIDSNGRTYSALLPESEFDKIVANSRQREATELGTKGGAIGGGISNPSGDVFAQMQAANANGKFASQDSISGRGRFAESFQAQATSVNDNLSALSQAGRDTAVLLQETTASAVQAAISGQESVLDATKKAIAGELSALAVKWSVQAIGAAASFNFKGAAGYAAAATAAAVAARKLGGSAAPTPQTQPGGGFSGGSRSLGPQGSNLVINVNGSNPIENAMAVDKALKKARQSGLVPSSDGPSRLVA